ncbi:hypothetical protein GCM10007100_24550 [Roseibacillus persicicus]|uniref:Uncharacterized protein n=1 Tax=Roseibacillus persicicus TaxID=454148 RepID=A0A918WL50_9BACT|nr:hypothetical protein GCM10007100_24550 [Roseibacillus persicicus]
MLRWSRFYLSGCPRPQSGRKSQRELLDSHPIGQRHTHDPFAGIAANFLEILPPKEPHPEVLWGIRGQWGFDGYAFS